MKRFLAFLLTTALILTSGISVFAIKGGDSDVSGTMAFEFNSASMINSLHYVERENASDPNAKLVPSTEQTKSYGYSAKLTIAGAYGTKFFFNNSAAAAFNDSSLNYVNIQIYNAQSTQKRLIFNVTYNAAGRVYIQPGWNVVTLPVTSCFNGGNRSLSTSSYEQSGENATAFNIAEVAGTDAITSGDVYYIDRIWLTESENDVQSYDIASDGAIIWNFNTTDAISAANSAVATATCGTITADKAFVNAYDLSATFTTNTTRRMQIKLPNNNMQAKDENGNYLYDYINILVGNPQSVAVTFGCGINTTSANTQVTLPANSWSLVSIKIDDLFLAGNSNYKRDGKNYGDSVEGIAFQMSDQVAGGNTTNAGIKYNLDMIWVSKTPAAKSGTAVGTTLVSQNPLTCTDALVTDNGNGTAYASCKISNWPGERFVVIFASYNADGSLNGLTMTKDYDGDENKETLVTTSSISIPEGGSTKIMVWNGFAHNTPMTVSK